MTPRTRNSILAAATLALIAPAAWAENGRPIVGTLTCKGEGTIGLILGSKEALDCTFKTAKGRTHSYAGTLTKLGLDLGIKGESTMLWTVLGSTDEIPSASLDGNYVGVSAEAAAGIGAGANALIGGSSSSVVLQPLSVEGQTGINVAAGVAELTLRSR